MFVHSWTIYPNQTNVDLIHLCAEEEEGEEIWWGPLGKGGGDHRVGETVWSSVEILAGLDMQFYPPLPLMNTAHLVYMKRFSRRHTAVSQQPEAPRLATTAHTPPCPVAPRTRGTADVGAQEKPGQYLADFW